MALYTFYLDRADGSALTLHALELADDDAAMEKGRWLLEEHRSCALLRIYIGDRELLRQDAGAAGEPRPPTPARAPGPHLPTTQAR